MAYARHASLRSNARKTADSLASGLGWFSIGLGLVELLVPQLLTRRLGQEGREPIIRLYGAREIVTGIGLLTARDRVPWLWGRVGGDVLDAATLLAGRRSGKTRDDNLRLALFAVIGIAALDLLSAGALSATKPGQTAIRYLPDYRNRSGLPRPPEAMRGAARDFRIPRDMRIPEAMRPYTSAGHS
jgi:hypothetical protein